MERLSGLSWCIVLFCGMAAGQTLKCDLQGYKPIDGLKAEISGGALNVAWRGESDQQLRAAFAIKDGQPVVQELAALKNGGKSCAFGPS